MSANKFKVGDKVKVRKGLVGGRCYDGVYCTSNMANSAGEIFMISAVEANTYKLESYDLWWTNEMLEPVEKTLDNLCAGDFVQRSGMTRKVLAAVDGCYLLSNTEEYTVSDEWYTASELAKYHFKPIDRENTIEIDGKKYKKADVEEAIKDLEVVD